MYLFNVSVYLLSSILFCSCHFNRNKQLEEALSLSSTNRIELEKVISHYQKKPLKQKAAIFLIENMPQYYSVSQNEDEKLGDLYNRHEAISQKYNWERPKEWELEIDSLTDENRSRYFLSSKIEKDIETIKADWLIRQIDLAFEAWQKNAYTKNLPFETFCNFILPYRFKNGIILDDSREKYYKKYGSLFQDSSRTFIEATDSLLYLYKDIFFNYYHGASIPIHSVKTLEKIKYGQCSDKSWHNSLLLASMGMAVCTDFVPARGNRNNPHTWNTLIVNNEAYPFEPFWNDDKWNYKVIFNNKAYDKAWGKFRLPKVYRQTFSVNRQGPLFDKQVKRKEIPALFRNPRLMDVSYQYFDTANITIPLPPSVDPEEQYAYICVYGYRDWIPVQWGKINDKQVSFKGMGKDIVYIAGLYKHGHIKPICNPFYLSDQGEITYLHPSGQKGDIYTRSIGCFWETEDKVKALHPLIGSVITGIRKDGNQIDTLGIMGDLTDMWENHIEVDSPHKYKSIEIEMPSDTLSLCEIAFFTKDNNSETRRITNVTLETEVIPINKQESISMLTDNRSATGLKAICKKKGTKRIRFNMPENYITGIDYMPYTVSRMRPDCKYKLYYWDIGWLPFNEQKGNNDILIFKDVPMGTLYRIENDSFQLQKNMERIFMYENGIIRWM